MTAEIVELSAQRDAFYTPAWQLFAWGEIAAPGQVKNVVEVKYDDGVERIDGFTLTVNNWDAERRRHIYFGPGAGEDPATDPDFFEPGRELSLWMGYQGNTTLMVTGMITSVDVQFPETGHSKLIVSGLNVLERFRRTQYTWSWPENPRDSITDSAVAEQLGVLPDETTHKPGLVDVDGRAVRVVVDAEARLREPIFSNIFMNNQFPIVFLMERARARGYQVLLREDDEGRHVYFGPTIQERDVTYVLEWGKSLVSFHPTYANARQVYAVKVCGWDRQAKTAIAERVTLDDLPGHGFTIPNRDHLPIARSANREEVIATPPAQTVQEAQRRACEALVRNQEGMVEASGTTIGLSLLRAGKIVHIRGTGRHFDGIYTILTTSHVLNDQGYRTSFTAKRANPEEPGAHFAGDLVPDSEVIMMDEMVITA